MEVREYKQDYPYYSFSEWQPDGKWFFFHGDKKLHICKFAMKITPEEKDEATVALVNIIYQDLQKDLLAQNKAKNTGALPLSEMTPGFFAYEEWRLLLGSTGGDVSDEAWIRFTSMLKPYILTWINEDSEMWAAYILTIKEMEAQAMVEHKGSAVQEFDENAPMEITGVINMDVGSLELG